MDVVKRFFVWGRVQGVFFRASTRTEANRLGLTGWARNLDDGRVEVLAVGSEAGVSELARWLEQGPPSARVDSVDAEELEAAPYQDLVDFSCG